MNLLYLCDHADHTCARGCRGHNNPHVHSSACDDAGCDAPAAQDRVRCVVYICDDCGRKIAQGCAAETPGLCIMCERKRERAKR